MWACSNQKTVYSTVRVNGCLFVVEQIDGICEVGSRERGFSKRRFFLDGFAYCVVVDLAEA